MIADEKKQMITDISDYICDHLVASHLCQSAQEQNFI